MKYIITSVKEISKLSPVCEFPLKIDLKGFYLRFRNDFSGHAVEPSEEEEDSTTNEVFYPGYPGKKIFIFI